LASLIFDLAELLLDCLTLEEPDLVQINLLTACGSCGSNRETTLGLFDIAQASGDSGKTSIKGPVWSAVRGQRSHAL
jgi:hypothetical protein